MGICGACTIQIDGQPTRSCITPISVAVGKRITTIEAIGTTPAGKRIQAAWLEVDVPQSPQDRNVEGYRVREYAHRFLDIFTVFFLVRFTKKPLRFFGMLGVSTFLIGVALLTYMVVVRMFFDVGLANRPALLLSSLLVVLGLQLFAIGLLGELIIFTHAKGLKDYQVDEVIEFNSEGERIRSHGNG